MQRNRAKQQNGKNQRSLQKNQRYQGNISCRNGHKAQHFFLPCSAYWGNLSLPKGEKERYKHLKAKFQRIARRDKKAFFSNQCKEIEENNRLGKTRDLFKKIRDTKGTFHAKMSSIKDRNGMDLAEAEDIKKRWQEYTEELYKKIFMTQKITMV